MMWTLTPFSDDGGLPPVVFFQWNDDTVYFAEIIQPQLQSNGTGLGMFANSNMTTPIKFEPGYVLNTCDIPQTIDPGAGILRLVHVNSCIIFWLILITLPSRFPKWGTRLHCANIPDGDKNL